MLEAFDVGPDAEAVYLALLERPEASAHALAVRLRLGDGEVRAAFTELAELSLLRPSWEDPAALRPVSPEVGLQALLARQHAEVLHRQRQLERGRAALAALAELVADEAGRRREGDAGVERLVGLDAVRERLERLTAATKTELTAFVPGGAQTDGARRASRPLDQVLLDRGVEMRSVYLDSVRNDPPTVDYARWLTGLGGQIRTVPSLPLRMIVADRETAVVPVDPEDSKMGALVLHGGGAVAAVLALFEHVWAGARPLGVASQRDEGGLTAQERALLQHLAAGDTDDIAARRLGVSGRTVRRSIAGLMDRLGAQSRFQAAALAAQRGWLDPPAVDEGGADPRTNDLTI